MDLHTPAPANPDHLHGPAPTPRCCWPGTFVRRLDLAGRRPVAPDGMLLAGKFNPTISKGSRFPVAPDGA